MPTTPGTYQYVPPSNPWTDHPAGERDVYNTFEEAVTAGLVYSAVMREHRSIVAEGDAHRDAQEMAAYALQSYVDHRIWVAGLTHEHIHDTALAAWNDAMGEHDDEAIAGMVALRAVGDWLMDHYAYTEARRDALYDAWHTDRTAP